MKVGIGVISYNRPKECQEVCESIINTVNHDAYDIQTICALDTEDKTGYDWVEENFGLISRPNKGIAVNKNRALKRLQDNDLIFLFEDDFKPKKKGWIELYATAINETKIQHFNHIRLDHRTKMLGQQRYPTVTLVFYENNTAQLMVFTKRVVEKVGAFDPEYGLYGFEHSDYTRRCKNLKLCQPANHNANHFVLESDLFFEEMPVPPCLSEEVMKESAEKANKHYMNYNRYRNYIPFPEGDF
jgi:glycosyltransferase involved in cell wall biosynthesis